MRIQSDFNDYYDGIATTFHDADDKLYLRKTKTLYGIPPGISRDERWRYRTPDFGLLYFCGKRYCGIGVGKAYYFTKESLRAYIDGLKEEKDRDAWLKADGGVRKWRERESAFERAVAFMEKYTGDASPEIFLKHDTPIIWHYHHDTEYDRVGKTWTVNVRGGWYFVINPCLKDITGITTFLDPYTVTQEIDMYLHGALCDHPKPMIQISDKDQVVAKGFDPKWSFRKHKDDPK